MPADGLSIKFALPDDVDLDTFESGNVEVDTYFRSRAWFNKDKGKAKPPTYKFSTEDGDTVGYAAVAFKKCEYPDDDSEGQERYLVIYAAGVCRDFQGKKNEHSGVPEESYAASLFGRIEQFAIDKPSCCGLYLWVREDNSRAIAFYKKVGFVVDPTGAAQRDDGKPHLTMRKVIRTST